MRVMKLVNTSITSMSMDTAVKSAPRFSINPLGTFYSTEAIKSIANLVEHQGPFKIMTGIASKILVGMKCTILTSGVHQVALPQPIIGLV